MDKIWNLKTERLIDLKERCKSMAILCDQLIDKQHKMIEFNGLTDKEEKELDSKINPELYYNYRCFDIGCSIVYTNWFLDTETDVTYKSPKKYHYSIKYYNCRSNVFRDKKCKLTYCYSNTCYGDFKTLEEAIPYFRRAVIDILVQYGKCNALNPFDFL